MSKHINAPRTMAEQLAEAVFKMPAVVNVVASTNTEVIDGAIWRLLSTGNEYPVSSIVERLVHYSAVQVLDRVSVLVKQKIILETNRLGTKWFKLAPGSKCPGSGNYTPTENNMNVDFETQQPTSNTNTQFVMRDHRDYDFSGKPPAGLTKDFEIPDDALVAPITDKVEPALENPVAATQEATQNVKDLVRQMADVKNKVTTVEKQLSELHGFDYNDGPFHNIWKLMSDGKSRTYHQIYDALIDEGVYDRSMPNNLSRMKIAGWFDVTNQNNNKATAESQYTLRPTSPEVPKGWVLTAKNLESLFPDNDEKKRNEKARQVDEQMKKIRQAQHDKHVKDILSKATFVGGEPCYNSDDTHGASMAQNNAGTQPLSQGIGPNHPTAAWMQNLRMSSENSGLKSAGDGCGPAPRWGTQAQNAANTSAQPLVSFNIKGVSLNIVELMHVLRHVQIARQSYGLSSNDSIIRNVVYIKDVEFSTAELVQIGAELRQLGIAI